MKMIRYLLWVVCLGVSLDIIAAQSSFNVMPPVDYAYKKGSTPIWKNASKNSNYIEPLFLQSTKHSNLPVTKEFKIGGGSAGTKLTFKNGSSNSVTVQLPSDVVTGMVYYSPMENTLSQSSSLLHFVGNEQQFDSTLVGMKQVTQPFTAVTPLFSNELTDKIKQSFNDSGVSSGVYVASLIVNYAYQYRQHQSGAMIKLINSFPVQIRVNYTATSLTSITKTGDGKFTYSILGTLDKPVIKGRTQFTLNIKGQSLTKLKMKLTDNQADPAQPYSLVHQSLDATAPIIPYNVRCNSCTGDGVLVKDGQKVSALPEINVPHGTYVTIHLDVDFEVEKYKEPSKPLISGIYKGQFMVLFSPI